MKSINSFGLHFNLKTEKCRDVKAPIYVAITVNGRKIFVTTKWYISIKCWDSAKGMGKNNTSEGKEINIYLDNIRQSIRECYQDFLVQRKTITAEIIKAAFLKTGDDEHTITDIAEYRNEISVSVLAAGTMKNYYTTQRYLSEFTFKKYKRKAFFLSELITSLYRTSKTFFVTINRLIIKNH